MNGPDLFVVCRNCGAEVSPYVTECPYCGRRVRRRAPRIGPDGAIDEPSRGRRERLPRVRRGEIPGIAAETRPVVTIALIVATALVALALNAGIVSPLALGLAGPANDEWWRLLTTSLVMPDLFYWFVTMLTVGIFGSHLERRFGPLAPLVVFAAAAAAGAYAAKLLGDLPALGANAAALGVLVAWLVDDRAAATRGDDRRSDLVGVAVIAAAIALFPLADESASFAAAAGGALAGLLCGLVLSLVRR